MSIKIAVGSSNGMVIDQHFGRGKKFYVFELIEEGNSKFIESREVQTQVQELVNTSCGSSCHSSGDDEASLINKINLLSDCQAVLVNQIGKGAEKLLIKNGISAFEAKGSIDKAFSRLYIYYKRTRQL